jgi:hypothetical protein
MRPIGPTLALSVTLALGVGVVASPPALATQPEPGIASPADDEVVVPGAPAIATVSAGDGTALISWTAPAEDGGAPVSRYEITAQANGMVTSFDGALTSGTISSLENGVATSFTVSAVNSAGNGPPSDASALVTPRAVAKIVVRRRSSSRLLYGAPTKVKAAVVSHGEAIAGEMVQLVAKPRPSTRWRVVESGLTNARGRVVLRTSLPRSSALRLRHRRSGLDAPDMSLEPVRVAKRVHVREGASTTKLGTPVLVHGRIAPKQSIGARVQLQQRRSGSWRKVASGPMVTRENYRIRWKPGRTDRFRLRVVRRGDVRLASGKSAVWTHRVRPESAADIAKDILRNDRIALAKIHVSGGGYLGTPHQNIVDVAAGRPARHSCSGGAPCGSTRLDLRLLQAVRDMGERGRITVSEIAGGIHAGRSDHYVGRAIDITWVDGRHVGWGAHYHMVVERCRAWNSEQVFTPANDPYGGHHNHVHCAWK